MKTLKLIGIPNGTKTNVRTSILQQEGAIIMKKFVFVAFIIALAVALIGCGSRTIAIAEVSTNPTSAPTEAIEEPTAIEMDYFTLDAIPTEDNASIDEQDAILEKEAHEQFLNDSIFHELEIGFENYGITVFFNGTDAYVFHGNIEWDVYTLCANNSYLEEHDVRFSVPKGTSITRFIPPTFESCGYVEDDDSTWASIGECRGYVWESELDSVTAIRWESQLIIEIDNIYHIYINYRDELPEDAYEILGIY